MIFPHTTTIQKDHSLFFLLVVFFICISYPDWSSKLSVFAYPWLHILTISARAGSNPLGLEPHPGHTRQFEMEKMRLKIYIYWLCIQDIYYIYTNIQILYIVFSLAFSPFGLNTPKSSICIPCVIVCVQK